MSQESVQTVETTSPEKRELLELEKEGKYLFHGSDNGEAVEEFEPRQAYNYDEPDGPPAVFAASVADYAIFMAIINKQNCAGSARINAGATQHPDGTIEMRFGATKDTMDRLKNDAEGWVYVFDKNQFQQREGGGIEYVSYQPVKPLRRVLVHRQDLPQKIRILSWKKEK